MTKTAQLADVSRAMVSKVMSAWTSEGKTSSAKGNSGRKRILLVGGSGSVQHILEVQGKAGEQLQIN